MMRVMGVTGSLTPATSKSLVRKGRVMPSSLLSPLEAWIGWNRVNNRVDSDRRSMWLSFSCGDEVVIFQLNTNKIWWEGGRW
mmetsp:Transcript_22744/g.34718  ORF Transcript_22744/g.34718 Transcript_22744/m.34718 type:complete len:82 (-) Transcript_22744:62-307(-)